MAPKKKDKLDLSPDLPLGDAARTLLAPQHQRLRQCLPKALRGDVDSLHDVRVAIRRTRCILRAFKPMLRHTKVDRVEKELARMGDAMGPTRDMDVLLGFTRRKKLARILGADPTWPPLEMRLRALHTFEKRRMVARLSGREWARMDRNLKQLAKATSNVGAGTTLPEFAGEELERLLGRVMKKKPLARSKNADRLHELRIAIRKARLFAQLVEPVLDEEAGGRIAELKDMERAIGRLHDADFAASILTQMETTVPKGLSSFLEKRRAKAFKKFHRLWSAFSTPSPS